MNALSFCGNVLFSTGPTPSLAAQMIRHAIWTFRYRAAASGWMTSHILDKGEFAYPELKAPGR